uniref:Periodic tryptophan protein putative n=1 Tax=Albugo laibachii Nc14 TaxID=890382 RepID=F0WDW4_9STRA|nr:periodic tryptophan protein putative [Albugo laibachii Nc14]|eukprot:CCA19392.1 periodic tryptophan protein putative [Albugo laibachii Nc14]
MISALAWVPKGASKRIPDKHKLTDEEIAMMQDTAMENSVEKANDEDLEDIPEEETSDLPASFRMERYDEVEDDIAIKNYIGGTLEDDEEVSDEEQTDQDMIDEEEIDVSRLKLEEEVEKDLELDQEDLEIRPNDIVILVANTEDDFSNLEVQIYDEETGSLYVHHEINLPDFPLCLSWMDVAPMAADPAKGSESGSFVAVGTFKPGIEIWNLDVLNVLEPSAILGGEEESMLKNGAPKAKKDRQIRLRPGSHTDAVMSLDWNHTHRNMLVSGSADHTVKVWDITTQNCLHTMHHHKNKVQCVRWNPSETTVLATASFDHRLLVLDGRHPDAFSSFSLSADVESIAWAPYQPNNVVAATEDGVVVCYDVRMNASEPLIRFQAHAGSVSAVSFAAQIPGMFATAGIDKTVKIWDMLHFVKEPKCIATKDMIVGGLYAMSFCIDTPFLLGCGGASGTLALWESSEKRVIEEHFQSRVHTDQQASVFAAAQVGEIAATLRVVDAQASTKQKKKKSKKKKSCQV